MCARIRASAAVLVEHRQRRRWIRKRRHVRRFAHAGFARQHVRIALRKQDHVALIEPDGWLSNRMSPAGASRDDVVFEDALRARHDDAGQTRARVALRAPTAS